jgi:hypothetical protein
VFLQLYWIQIAHWITRNSDAAFDKQPQWFKNVEFLISCIPVASMLVVIGLRFFRGAKVKVFSYIFGLAAPFFTMIAIISFGPTISGYIYQEDFDAVEWRAQDRSFSDPMWPPRLRMVDNLISSGRLNGLSETEVFELLGPPQEKGFPYGVAKEDTHYYLGPERGIVRMDSEWLVIRFNSEGKVEKYWIYRD